MLFAFLSYRGHFTERLRGLVEQLVGLRTLQVHLQRLAEIWCERPESLAPNGYTPNDVIVPDGDSPLNLCDVSYRHNATSPWVFAQLNLTVGSGEFIAVIGPSGGGKTTLLKLFMGLIAPSQGRVEWGGRQIIGEMSAAIRARSGCVLQGDAFFTGSIAENISFFEALDIDRLEYCLAAVQMLEVLQQMPMRYNTQVGDIGLGLSSGQMQRLLLARALYRDPQFLFLDEGTANLDTHSAGLIHALVKSLACTRIVVTHDLGFAACADRVVQLEGGRLRPVTLATRSAVVASAD
jgi:ATP-binding cassette subfamily B protein RaxB